MTLRRILPFVLAAACAALTAACGYHLAGRGSSLPEHVKSIGVPEFTNSTTRPELGQRITEKVTEELVKRGKFKVTNGEAGMDAVLSGVVESWTSRPVQLGEQRSEAERVAVTLRASVRFEDRTTGRVLYENPSYQFTREYEVVGDPDEYFDKELDAVDEVAKDFARAVISACLQGF